MMRKIRKTALDASKAPVKDESISPERAGKVFDRWNDEMKMKGPPRAKKRYPAIYPSNGRWFASARRSAPTKRKILPIIPHTRGPYVSRIVPTGRADTFVATAAIVNIRLRLHRG